MISIQVISIHQNENNSPVLTGCDIFPGEPFTWENQPEPVIWQEAIEKARNYDPQVDRYRVKSDSNLLYSQKDKDERKYRRVKYFLIKKSHKNKEAPEWKS